MFEAAPDSIQALVMKANLSPQELTVISHMCGSERLTDNAEIGQRMDLPKATIAVYKCQARAKLKKAAEAAERDARGRGEELQDEADTSTAYGFYRTLLAGLQPAHTAPRAPHISEVWREKVDGCEVTLASTTVVHATGKLITADDLVGVSAGYRQMTARENRERVAALQAAGL